MPNKPTPAEVADNAWIVKFREGKRGWSDAHLVAKFNPCTPERTLCGKWVDSTKLDPAPSNMRRCVVCHYRAEMGDEFEF